MRLPSSNLLLMAGSICLAVLLWMWVGAEERSEIVLSVPLEYRNLAKGHEIVTGDGQLLTAVNVWVRGNAATIKNLRPGQVSAWVDLAGTKPGVKHFELGANHVSVPYGLSVLRISPSRVNLRIEQVIRRLVAVVPQLNGQPAEGFVIANTVVVPPQAEVAGPYSAVNSVSKVITDSINVAGRSENLEETVNIGVENSAVRLGQIKQVTVSLTISPIQDVITLRHIPVTVKGNARTVRLTPRSVRAELLAPKNVLAKITEGQVKAFIEVEGLKPGFYELTPRIVVDGLEAKKISIKGVVPARVRVRIQ